MTHQTVDIARFQGVLTSPAGDSMDTAGMVAMVTESGTLLVHWRETKGHSEKCLVCSDHGSSVASHDRRDFWHWKQVTRSLVMLLNMD